MLVVVCGYCGLSYAGNAQNQLSDLQQKIAKVKQEKGLLAKQKKSLITRLEELDSKYGKSTFNLHTLQKFIGKITTTIKQNKQKIRAKQQQLNSQKDQLKEQIKIAHRLGKNDKLKLLLSQTNSATATRMLAYYDYLNNARLKIINAIDGDLHTLYALKQKNRDQNTLLADKLKQAKRQQAIIVNSKNKLKNLLRKNDKHFASNEQQLNTFKSGKKKLTALLQRLQTNTGYADARPFASLKGKLPWPVKGKIGKKFATKRASGSWDGVLIDAKEGDSIRAVASGKVVYADWLRGYGLLTIIEHSKSYMTLYAFSQSLYKIVGDQVQQGAVIATVGGSGGRAKSGLYFAIRKNGKPINPAKWCKRFN